MKTPRIHPFLLCLGVYILLAGCSGSSNNTGGGGGGGGSQAPSVTSISPTSVMAGSGNLTLTVNGSGFITTTTVQVGGVAEQTAYVSSTQVTATISASQLASGAQLSVIALNGSLSSGSGTPVNLQVSNPSPTITSVSPNIEATGATSPVVSVTGTGFVASTQIQVNGISRTTTFVSATQVNVTLSAADVATPGTLSLTAVNGAPGGGTSTAAAVAVADPLPIPILSSVSPTNILPGTGPTTVTITGGNFVAASTVLLNGSAVPSTFISSTQLTISVGKQSSAQQFAVNVNNPSPGGGTSSTQYFYALAPTAAPVISSVSPTQFAVGSGATSITVYGSNFMQQVSTSPVVWESTSTVLWNGTPLTTGAFGVGTNQSLYAQVPASLLASTGTANITVTSTVATPSTSNAIPVTITNSAPPTLTSISPVGGPMNTAASLTLSGTGFTASSTVAVNGVNYAANFVNSSLLTVTIPASAIQLPGNLNVTVTSPAPGGGTSAPLTYMAYISIPNNSMVYNPVNGLLYVSVPGSAGSPYGNSVVSVDPETGALGTPISVGSEPDQMAISSDGTILWVGLDGASAVREVNLSTGTAGLQFSLGGNGGIANPPKALALAALPGSPNSVVVATQTPLITSNGSEGTVAIFDSGVLRGSAVNGAVNDVYYALAVNGAKSEIYAGGEGYQTFTYNTSGLTPLATGPSGFTYASLGGQDMQIAGGTLYTDFGQAFDAESGALLGTFCLNSTTTAQGPTVADTALGLDFVLDSSVYLYSGVFNQIQTFNLSNYTVTGSAVIPIGLPPTVNGASNYNASHLIRWSTNGLAFRASIGIFSVRSNLVKDLSSVNADLGVALQTSGGSTTGTNTTYTATITNNGPSPSTNVALTAAPPSVGVLESATASTGTCSIGSTISCDLGGLANGASATVTFIVNQTSAGTATLTTQVSGSETDPNPANNSATASVMTTGPTYNLTPSLSAISPAAIQSGSSDTTITVTGTGFSSSSSVLLSGAALSTSYLSSTELTATVPQAALQNLGWAPISVSTPTPGGGVSNPLPLSVFGVIALGLNHIVYDPYSQKIMASVGSGSSTVVGNSLVAITPETATVGTPVPIGGQPTNLALTSDGQTLYTLLAGTRSIGVFNMMTQSAEFIYTVQPGTGTDTNPEPRGIATQPGSESTVAIDLGSNAGNAIYSFDLINKTAAMVGQTSGQDTGSCIQFLDASDMLAFDTDNGGRGLFHYTVTSAGFTYNDNSQYTLSALNGFGCFKLSGGLAFGNNGGVANPSAVPATQLGVFPEVGGAYLTSTPPAPDTSLQSAFYPVEIEVPGTTYNEGTPNAIESFNLNTFMPVSEISLNMATIEGNTTYAGVDIIRWGQDGLAVLTSTGHLYLIRGAFVVPQELATNSAASLTSSSATTLAHGAGNTLLTLTGTNFLPGVAVTWNGSYRTTTIVDPSHVTVAIPANDLANAGVGSLVATNPGATASNALTITIN